MTGTDEGRCSTLAGGISPRLAIIGLVGGAVSGLLGVGGGVVMVPLLVLWAGFAQRDAHATSLGAIIPISVVSVAAFGVAGEVQVREAVLLAAGSMVGAGFGARMLVRADERTLKLAFSVFVIVVAVVVGVRT